MNKLKIYHFHNGSGGGVFSIIKSLLEYNQNYMIENHVIYTINKDIISNYTVHNLKGAKSEVIFNYTPRDNFYYTCQKLNSLLDSDAIIIAHDWLELGMISNLGLQFPVVFILHGDFKYYYDLAVTHSEIIDKFVCVSNVIRDKLIKLLKYDSKVFSFIYPVPIFEYSFKNKQQISCAYYVNDLLDERKQFKLLPEIDSLLLKRGIKIIWHIAGGGVDINYIKSIWSNYSEDRILFHGILSSNQVFDFLKECQVMILPSLSEGLPVSVVESMKIGLVPIVNDWNAASAHLVNENTGFTIANNSVQEYANVLEYLTLNRDVLSVLSKNASDLANNLFNPFSNTSYFNEMISDICTKRKKISPKKIYGSRLDVIYFPNFLINFIRTIIYGR